MESVSNPSGIASCRGARLGFEPPPKRRGWVTETPPPSCRGVCVEVDVYELWG
ncbi:MAG: hypothetical protein QXT27_00410 [Pyrobaculum sp.]